MKNLGTFILCLMLIIGSADIGYRFFAVPYFEGIQVGLLLCILSMVIFIYNRHK